MCARPVVLAAAALAFGSAASVPQVSLAQSACTCLVPIGSAGLLSQPSGEVYASGRVEVITTEIPLVAGTQVSTGASGSAAIFFSESCSFDMEGNAQVTVTATESDVCVRLVEDGAGLGAAALFAGAAAAGVAAIAVGVGDDDPVSKP